MIETSLQQEPVALPGRPFGRMARSVAGYTLLTGLMFVTQLFVFVPAALFQCAIRNGRRAAWLVMLMATVLAALSLVQLAQKPGVNPDDLKMMYSALVAVVLAVAFPALMAVPLVERGVSFGWVLMFTTVGAAVGLFATELAMRGAMDFSPFARHLFEVQKNIGDGVRQAGFPQAYAQMMEKMSDVVAICLPAFTLIPMIVAFALSLAMFARLDFRRTGGERSRVYLFRNLSLPDWVLFAFVLGGLTPLTSGRLQMVAANVLAVVTFLYFLQGLAIFRSMLASMGMSFLGVAIGFLFMGFLIVFGVALLPLSIAGLFDSFFDFRHFKRKDDSHEGHSD
jgi:hypothetical protein